MLILKTAVLPVFTLWASALFAQNLFQKVCFFPHVQGFIADMEVLPDGHIALPGSSYPENDLNKRRLLVLPDTNGDTENAKKMTDAGDVALLR